MQELLEQTTQPYQVWRIIIIIAHTYPLRVDGWNGERNVVANIFNSIFIYVHEFLMYFCLARALPLSLSLLRPMRLMLQDAAVKRQQSRALGNYIFLSSPFHIIIYHQTYLVAVESYVVVHTQTQYILVTSEHTAEQTEC